MGEDALRIVTQLFNNTYETGEWPKDVIGVTMIAYKKPNVKNAATIAHTAQIVARIFRRRIERKISICVE